MSDYVRIYCFSVVAPVILKDDYVHDEETVVGLSTRFPFSYLVPPFNDPPPFAPSIFRAPA